MITSAPARPNNLYHYRHTHRRQNDVRKFEYGINPNNEITRLYGAVRIDEDYYRVKVTLKRDITNKEPFGAYSYEATSIEVLKEDIKGRNKKIAQTIWIP